MIAPSSPVKETISSSLSARRASCATCSTSARVMRSAIGERLLVRVEAAERQFPPLGGRRTPFGIGIDAVDGAGGKAIVATAAELRDDHDVGSVVEDRTEL